MTQPDAPGEPSTAGTDRWTLIALQAAAVAVLLVAVAGSLTPGRLGHALDVVAVAIVITTPLLRVAALAASFARERDTRFVVAALALLAVVAAGAFLA